MTDSNEIIFLVESSSEGGYEARTLSASIFTEADTVDELKAMVKDAVMCHFDDTERSPIIRLHYAPPAYPDCSGCQGIENGRSLWDGKSEQFSLRRL